MLNIWIHKVPILLVDDVSCWSDCGRIYCATAEFGEAPHRLSSDWLLISSNLHTHLEINPTLNITDVRPLQTYIPPLRWPPMVHTSRVC